MMLGYGLFIMNGFDIVFTLIGVHRLGYTEGNVLLRGLVHNHPFWFVIVKCAFGVALLLALNHTYKQKEQALKIPLFGQASMTLLSVIAFVSYFATVIGWWSLILGGIK